MMRINNKKEILKYMDDVLFFFRSYLRSKDFVEILTPKLVPVATDPIRGTKKEIFIVFSTNGQKRGLLAQSPQMFKQMAVCYGLQRVYEICPTWRDNVEKTERHNDEFWTIDVEMAGISTEDQLMTFLGNMIKCVSDRIFKKYHLKIGDVKYPIPVILYDDAISLLNDNGINIKWGEDIGPDREKKLANLLKNTVGDMFFIKKYPKSVKKFYIKSYDDDNKYKHAFDLIFKGWEISSGGIRETNIKIIIEKMEEFGVNPRDYMFYLKVLEENPTNHGGFSLGFDRFIAKSLNIDNINKFKKHLWGLNYETK